MKKVLLSTVVLFAMSGTAFAQTATAGSGSTAVDTDDSAQAAITGESASATVTNGLPGFLNRTSEAEVGDGVIVRTFGNELFFNNARVPSTALIGPEEGQGFIQMMQQLPWERLIIAILGVGIAEAALQEAVSYTQERKAFGKSIAEFQNTRFKLAEAKTKIEFAKAKMGVQCCDTNIDKLTLKLRITLG